MFNYILPLVLFFLFVCHRFASLKYIPIVTTLHVSDINDVYQKGPKKAQKKCLRRYFAYYKISLFKLSELHLFLVSTFYATQIIRLCAIFKFSHDFFFFYYSFFCFLYDLFIYLLVFELNIKLSVKFYRRFMCSMYFFNCFITLYSHRYTVRLISLQFYVIYF